MPVYYNEFDPKKAAWLRDLIKAGVIADGIVDERSVTDVLAGDLSGFSQCHFFAGIGIWSYALRLAGWPDDRQVWTGSCPCQPFSSAGRQEGFEDERHLWPVWFRLIRERQPVVCFGEQVANNHGLAWIDLVHSDMEGAGYTVGETDLCAAGFGAPHIRQRLYFVADTTRGRCGILWNATFQRSSGYTDGGVVADILGDADSSRPQRRVIGGDGSDELLTGKTGMAGIMGNSSSDDERRHSISGRDREGISPRGPGRTGQLGDADGERLHGIDTSICERRSLENSTEVAGPGPVNGFWRDAEWIWCRAEREGGQGKYRPVKPGSFPLAHGSTARVGRLRGYGDGIVAEVAKAFIEAYMTL